MTLVARVAAVIDGVRDRALAEFGWTHVDLTPSVRDDGVVALAGTVAARGLVDRVRRACAAIATLDTTGIGVMRTDRFVAVPSSGVALHRRPDRAIAGDLATELDADDGPIEWLAERDAAVLVRARDGTVGWVHTVLDATLVAARDDAPHRCELDRVEVAWPSWIDAPYRLGGTRRTGVDCSGLVQRLLAAAGLRVPRHSTDQLAIGPQPGPGRADGDIVAIWSNDEAPCHVGLRVSGARVIQASRSQAKVVVVGCDDFIARAERVEHVPIDAVIDLDRRAAGRHDLLAVLFG